MNEKQASSILSYEDSKLVCAMSIRRYPPIRDTLACPPRGMPYEGLNCILFRGLRRRAYLISCTAHIAETSQKFPLDILRKSLFTCIKLDLIWPWRGHVIVDFLWWCFDHQLALIDTRMLFKDKLHLNHQHHPSTSTFSASQLAPIASPAYLKSWRSQLPPTTKLGSWVLVDRSRCCCSSLVRHLLTIL
jgi:hypothetical protein